MVREGHALMLLLVAQGVGVPTASPSSTWEDLVWWKGWILQSPILSLHSHGAELTPKSAMEERPGSKDSGLCGEVLFFIWTDLCQRIMTYLSSYSALGWLFAS